tara:strand:- start:296 stop:1204 length:909 start_codon:yes stop_codon:yes gene_type:complete
MGDIVMKCLVTGGAGFIGTNLIKRLLRDGHEVISIDNYCTGFKENEQDGCKYYNSDVKDNFWDLSTNCQCEVSCDCSIGEVDVIFHLAALARIQPSFDEPKKTLDTNITGTVNILEWARHNDIQVVYAGSSSMHHGIFNSPYAWSKYNGEELCKLYSKIYNLNTTICRFYNVYGPHHIRTGNYATVIGVFEQQYLDNHPLTITDDGEQRRDFTHVDDIVDGLVRCAGKDFRAEEFELGRGINYSINEIADMFGGDYPKKYILKRAGEYDMTLCTDDKAYKLLNWKPTKNIEEYVKKWIKGRI